MPATAEKEPKVKEPKELSQLEQMNNVMADAWEQMGLFKALAIQKATALKMANLGGMPLSGIDVIKTQAGPRLYINNVGAKYNRDSYLGAQNREIAGRVVEMFDAIPSSNPEQDKAQGRKYFKTTTKVKSPEYAKIVDGIAAGRVNAETGLKLLEKIMEANTYTSHSAFSYQSESFAANRMPEHIIKKGQTQAHRRADLEISMQCVFPADEEPVDAEFTVKAGDVLDKAKEAAGGAGPDMKVAKVVDVTPAAPAAHARPQEAQKAPGPVGEGTSTPAAKPEDPEAIKNRIGELRTVFDQAGISKFDGQKFMVDNHFPIKPREMTVAILDKAIVAARAKFLAKPAPTPADPVQQAETPAEAPKQAPEDPERNALLATIFGLREKAGFADDDKIREWVKMGALKGLSEMTSKEIGEVKMAVQKLAGILGKHQKWGMASTDAVKEFAFDSKGKQLHDMSVDELGKFETELDEML
jgi:predicted small integral membrane protein